MTGDGELQEGQNWEALQAAAHERLGRLWVVVDRNEVQSDKRTEEIVALGDLEGKIRAFGWQVETVDGHDHAALAQGVRAFGDGRRRAEGPRRADGQGQGRLVHGASGRARRGRRTYRWHAGAPATSRSHRPSRSSEARLADRCAALGSTRPRSSPSSPRLRARPRGRAGGRNPASTA